MRKLAWGLTFALTLLFRQHAAQAQESDDIASDNGPELSA